MLRTCLFESCRTLASSSSSSFHTSATLLKISEARLRARVVKKNNLERQEARARKRQETRPSVILGTRPGEEDKWRNCYLARLLVDESVFTEPPAMVQSQHGVEMSEYKAFGVATAEEKKLFRDLPRLSVDLWNDATKTPTEQVQETRQRVLREQEKAANFAKVIDLRNADAGGIAYENRRRIILGFSTPVNPFDPGRTEVQAAILTYRIRKLYAHLTRCKHDVQNKLSLRKLVHQRAKVLKYLKRTERVRYDTLMEQLAIEPEAVEGELAVQ